MRHLQRTRDVDAAAYAGNDAESRHIGCFLALEQPLHPETDAEEDSALDPLPDRLAPRPAEHCRCREVSDPGHDDSWCAFQLDRRSRAIELRTDSGEAFSTDVRLPAP